MSGPEVVSVDPWSGATVCSHAPADPELVVRRCLAAAAPWSRTPLRARRELLWRFADSLDADSDRLADLITAEVGKRRVDAVDEVAWAALTARWYADHPPPTGQAGSAQVVRQPIGVVAAVTPWNVPLITPMWKVLPALMSGNAVVWKPSEKATGIAVAAGRLLSRAGLPDDVLSIAAGGPPLARSLCVDHRVALVHFTGSSAGGREVATLTAARLARCVLELGSVNPALVFADADLDLAADAIVTAASALAGQKCTATRRVLVSEHVHRALLDRLALRMDALRVGHPRDPATDVGPMIDRGAVDRATADHAAARASGARPVVQARADGPRSAALFGPALLDYGHNVNELRHRELFSALLTVESFAASDDPWARANDAASGLSASIFTTDPDRLAQAPGLLRAGVVALNRRADQVSLEAPFAGAGPSGNGIPEGGLTAYDGVTSVQAIYSGG